MFRKEGRDVSLDVAESWACTMFQLPLTTPAIRPEPTAIAGVESPTIAEVARAPTMLPPLIASTFLIASFSMFVGIAVGLCARKNMVFNIPSKIGKKRRSPPPPPAEQGPSLPAGPPPAAPDDFWSSPAAQDKWLYDIARWNGTADASFMGGLWSPSLDKALMQIPTPIFMFGEGLVLVRGLQEPEWLNKYTLLAAVGGLLLYRKETMS